MNTLDFLQKWRPGGPWLLTAISVDQKRIDTATFTRPEDVQAWLEKHAERNHYFAVNPARKALDKKATRKDVASLDWLHVDIDARVGEPLDEEFERIRGRLENPLGGIPRPTCVIFSGGGYQAFWRLEEPIAIDGQLDAAEDAKLWNLQLEMAFGADACHNVDRIMRLPGTVNRPNAKKRERGRAEALATVEWFDDVAYPIDAFTKATPLTQVGNESGFTGGTAVSPVQVSGNIRRLTKVEEVDEFSTERVPDWCKMLIVQGDWPDYDDRYGTQSRSERLYAVCCELVRCGVDDATIYAVVTDPDWRISESVLDKGSGVERYALRQIARAREFAVDPLLAELNSRYAVIQNIGGKCRVVQEVETHGRMALTHITFGDFRNALCNRKKEYTFEDDNGKTQTKTVMLGDWWLHHPMRRQYERIIFEPGKDEPGCYNLWHGYAVDAIPGDCDLFLDHLRDNICSGDEDHYAYLIRWLARTVQRPDEPGHTAVVLRGRQGTGKSFFVEQFGALFGRHYLAVSNSKHLIGHFNAHLQDCIVLFGDEAFYAGDKKHSSVLKTLITESHITIERKGVDATPSKNCVHLLMASNEDWVVPAGFDDRRFFVLDVSAERACDTAYFVAIKKQMDAGGREALLHYLLNLNIAGFEVRNVPKTEALQTQKTMSLDPEREWWFSILRNGRLSEQHEDWTGEVLAKELQVSFYKAMRNNRSMKANESMLGNLLLQMCGGHAGLRKVRKSESAKIVDEAGHQITIARPMVYQVPSLEECRAIWNETCFEYRWEEIEQEPIDDGGGAF